jgi:hypothetical protein
VLYPRRQNSLSAIRAFYDNTVADFLISSIHYSIHLKRINYITLLAETTTHFTKGHSFTTKFKGSVSVSQNNFVFAKERGERIV